LKIFPKQEGILGYYNTSNIGDLALGKTFQRILREEGYDAPLLQMTELERLKMTRRLFLGGGGVITTHPSSKFAPLAALRAESANETALVGVSGNLFREECSESMLALLRGAAYFSARSSRECEAFRTVCGRQDIHYHPDIAFAFGKRSQPEDRGLRKRRVGINISPFLMKSNGRQFVANPVASEWFKRHLPDEALVYPQISAVYLRIIEGLVEIFEERKWDIRVVPFAIEDACFAEGLFRGRHCIPYTHEPSKVLRQVAECDLFISTRFHGLVFALQAGVPCLSMAYAQKCRFLFEDLKLDQAACVGPIEMVEHPDRAIEMLSTHAGVGLDSQALTEARGAAERGCRLAIENLLR
jgi:polysaccharide pyruvyl transferase WcaK-like protein